MDPIITIGREYGSGGREIGKLVADKLGVPFYDTYHRLGVTEDNAADYLADAVHLNEEGRFLFGTALIATLDHSR